MTIKSKLIEGMKDQTKGMANRTEIKDQTTTTMRLEIKDSTRTKGTTKITKSLATTMIRTKVVGSKTKIVVFSKTILMIDKTNFKISKGSR